MPPGSRADCAAWEELAAETPQDTLPERLRRTGFTASEFALLARARRASDELARTEVAAMDRVVPGRPADPGGLYDPAYQRAKAEVMTPLARMVGAADARTRRAVEFAEHAERLSLGFTLVFGVLLGGLLWKMRSERRRLLGADVETVHDLIEQIGSGQRGDSRFAAEAPRDSVLAWLGETQKRLADMEAERRKAEAALRESGEQLRLLIEQTPTSLAMFDRDMGYLAASRSWVKDYGLEGRELVGRSHYAIFPDIPEAWKAVHRRGLAGETIRADDDRFERADGSVQWLRWVVQPWRRADGEIGGIAILTEDITAIKRIEAALRASEERYRLAQELAGMGVLDRDLAAGEVSWTPGLERLYGLEPGSVHSLEELVRPIPAEDYERIKGLRDVSIRDHLPFEAEYRVRHGDGQTRWLYGRGAAIYDSDGRPLRFLVMHIDVTARKTAESELERSRAELERRVDERTRELSVAKESAESASRAKSDFLSNVSHEIRTPLGAVLGMAHLLDETSLDGAQRATLGKLQAAGRALLAIVNDVLDLAKIESGELEIEHAPFSLARLVDELRELFSAQAAERGLVLDIGGLPDTVPAVVVGDEVRLRQILINLLGNALKFTPAGRVELHIAAVDGLPAWLRFEVRDTGIGIAADVLPRLFAPFTQAESDTTRRYGGTGLGLSIVRRLAEGMGGRVEVGSRPGEGSVFRVELPLPATDAAALPQFERLDIVRHRWLVGVRLLLVDDSESNLDVARAILERQGATVEVRRDGQQALDWLDAHPGEADVVLMDVQMPVMGGYEATRRIRADARHAALPVVALTAGALLSQKVQAEAAGASAWLTKPFAPEALVVEVRAQVGRYRGGQPDPVAQDGGTASGLWPVLPGVDTERARRQLLDDPALFRDLLQRFVDSAGETSARLDARLAAGDADNAAVLLHKHRGQVTLFGAMRLGAAAQTLENALRDGTVDPTPLRAGLAAVLDELLPAARAWLSQTEPEARDADTQEAIDVDRLIADLTAKLEGNLLDTTPEIDLLAPALVRSPQAAEAAAVVAAVRRLDYPAALTRLNAIAAERATPQSV